MYFKPKSNLERVIDELKARHYDFTEYEPQKPKKNHTVTRFHPRKTWISLPNFVSEPRPEEKELDESHSEEIIPKQILAGLHNKTYFKGVTSLMLSPDVKFVKNPKMEPFADMILQNCNVKPSSHSSFLRAGDGKLVSNPEESVKETSLKLRRSMLND